MKNSYQPLSEIALELEINYGMEMDTKLVKTHPSFSWVPSTSQGIYAPSGSLGTNPFVIRKYLIAHKYKYEQTTSLSELQSWVKPGRVFIMSYWNNKDDITGGLHTIAAYVKIDGTIETFNNGNKNSFYSFTDLINKENGAFIVGYYLY